MSNNTERVNVRYVEVRGVKYFRAEDIVGYFRFFAEGEETDVRNRILDGARALASNDGNIKLSRL